MKRKNDDMRLIKSVNIVAKSIIVILGVVFAIATVYVLATLDTLGVSGIDQFGERAVFATMWGLVAMVAYAYTDVKLEEHKQRRRDTSQSARCPNCFRYNVSVSDGIFQCDSCGFRRLEGE